MTEQNALAEPMPDFARIGLRHVYPDGGTEDEFLGRDLESMLDSLEDIQR
jgi:hypothetical protein